MCNQFRTKLSRYTWNLLKINQSQYTICYLFCVYVWLVSLVQICRWVFCVAVETEQGNVFFFLSAHRKKPKHSNETTGNKMCSLRHLNWNWRKSLSPKDGMNEFFSLLFEVEHDIFNIGSCLLFYKFFRSWFSWFLYAVSTSIFFIFLFLFYFVLFFCTVPAYLGHTYFNDFLLD